MNPRTEAIEILQQARETLARRLTERILESRQEILSDAEGESYLSEIEAVYEQLGSRLAHLGTMLSHLPLADEPRASEPPLGEPIFTDLSTATTFGAELHSASLATPPALALPAPEVTEVPPPAPCLQTIAWQAQAGDLAQAGRALGELLGLEPGRARVCAERFAEQLRTDPELLARAAQLRSELASSSGGGALALLADCFGLQALESLRALEALRARFDETERGGA
jgi:hypothetical protein